MAMQSKLQGRPYRSHLHPACHACRQRKSRCKVEALSSSCLKCIVHETECTFPAYSSLRTRQAYPPTRSPNTLISTWLPLAGLGPANSEQPSPAVDADIPVSQTKFSTWADLPEDERLSQLTPLSVDDAEEGNPHIVGPAHTPDSQILADYVSIIGSSSTGNIRVVRPVPASRSEPVLFVTVQKRPLGVDVGANPSGQKLQMIEKLIEPYLEDLTDLYFSKENICLPLLDVVSFQTQYRIDKDKISPALLACMYAHSMVYWNCSPWLRNKRVPDSRFIWNLANEVLYSELHLSPGISTVTAILLSIGGRPTTSLAGNGVQMGAAVSLANSLGLNRNPLSWDMPDAEKFLRMKIWWSLLIHDKWISLSYGTPSHIQMGQHDVPRPEIGQICQRGQNASSKDLEAASIFVALAGLTDVLDYYLQYLYQVDGNDNHSITSLQSRLHQWVESLETNVRNVITRGTRLHQPGATNLRLLYLWVELLLRSLELDEDRDKKAIQEEAVFNRYMQVRRTAEEIVFQVQELREEQLWDFWLPVAAFVFPAATTFLLRCAFEMEDSHAGLAKSSSLRLAGDLISALRCHRAAIGWELGDVCLVQHAATVERLLGRSPQPALEQTDFPDMSFVGDMFPNLWDTFKGI